jgi:uncharacterized heparinase superfamily protein
MWRPLRRPRLRSLEVTPRVRAGEWTPSIVRPNPWLGGKRWLHLNQEREIVTWNDPGIDKLWLYHLHYHERPCADTVLDWIEQNPPGVGNGWEPYPLSRRISNWISWRMQEQSLPEDTLRVIEESLASQLEWLSHQVEWHLLANHVLANAKALVMGGLFFSGQAADIWLRKGIEILRRELPEQVLDDGAHFELSPMYHALALEDILDLINLVRAYPQTAATQEESEWRRIAAKMLGWLAQLTHPDGELAYFNDSVRGVAPTLAQLCLYACRLGIRESRIPLSSSGYKRIESGTTVVFYDTGEIGPAYQPGHGHCDLLSLEISHNGRRVIANSGVSTYEPSPQRLSERGTSAHNTLRVDSAEQSEVWSSFRVGRRARVLESKMENQSCASGAHDGYRFLKNKVIHRRQVRVSDGNVTVVDRLQGTGRHTAEIFWHPLPDAPVEIEFQNPLARQEERGWWCAGFNQRIERTAIVGTWRGQLPVELTTHLHFV